MNLNEFVNEKLKSVVPEEALKTILFAAVENTSYEIFFYSFFPQEGFRQCYALAEAGMLDASVLDQTFEIIAEHIRLDQNYQENGLNVYTVFCDGDGSEIKKEYFEKDSRIYRIKKNWMDQYLR